MKNRAVLTFAAFLLFAAAQLPASVRAQTATPPPPRAAPQPTPHPATALAEAAARPGWRRYQFGDAPAFSVIMPAPPQASADGTPIAGGGLMVTHVYISSGGGGIYAAARLDNLPANVERVSEAERQGFFDSFSRGFVKGFTDSLRQNSLDFELKMLEPKKVTAAGRGGFEQDFSVGPFKGRTQLVFAGRSAFCVMSIWGQETAAADYEAFFNSFRVSGAPKAD